MKVNCLSASIITALLMAISVFLGNVSHTEYKSQMRKRKVQRIEYVDDTLTDTRDNVENV